MAYLPIQSVTAFQSVYADLRTATSIVGTVPITQSGIWRVSIAGIPEASVHGRVTINPSSVFVVNPVSTITVTTGNSSVQVLNPVSLITVTQGTTPWVTTGSVQGTISVLGTVPVTQSTTPWVINMPSPSIIMYQAAGSTLAVNATVNTGNSSVQLLGGVAVIGSVAVLQGTNPWQVNVPTPSYIAIQSGGSVQAVRTDNSSVVVAGATLADIKTAVETIDNTVNNEDTGHSTGAAGLFILGVRNDLLASIVSANLNYAPITTDSFGRATIKPFAPDEATFSYVNSVVSGSVTLIAASVIGKRNYITDFMFANSGSVATIITFRDGSTSILGHTIAPATSGSNKHLAVTIKSFPSQDLTYSISPAVSVLYATVQGYIAP